MKVLVTLLAISAFALGATPALAAPPSNDTIAGATAIAGLPFSATVQSTEATTDADELAAAAPCLDLGAPAVEKAVWYTYTASTDATLLIDATASDYPTGIAVYNGPPSAETFVTCAPGALVTPVTSGQTVYVMVFAASPGSAGGTLQITVQEAPPAPEVSLTVDDRGSFDPQSGSATISGTYTCTGSAQFAGIEGTLTQEVGRFRIIGSFFVPLTCDGTTQAWTAEVTAFNGDFKGGHATVMAVAFACTSFGACDQAIVTQPVRLGR
jgi:hypothetical protein